jgi:hypothetical protein
MDGMMNTPFPADPMEWATASTQDSTSWIHIDGNGVATVSSIIAGFKYWVFAVPKRRNGQEKLSGDMGSINAFDPQSWSPEIACEELWDFEGILLGPGDSL